MNRRRAVWLRRIHIDAFLQEHANLRTLSTLDRVDQRQVGGGSREREEEPG
jgi:hypothetical protein